jgi:hypothetical protein
MSPRPLSWLASATLQVGQASATVANNKQIDKAMNPGNKAFVSLLKKMWHFIVNFLGVNSPVL